MERIWKYLLPSLLVVISIAVSYFFIKIANERALTEIEGVLLQCVCLGLSIVGSFLFGKISAQQAAEKLVKPHAKSAFRRLISLYKSLSRVAFIITQSEDAKPTDQKIVLSQVAAIVQQQIDTADDALEDWRDLVPNEVDELKKKLNADNGGV